MAFAPLTAILVENYGWKGAHLVFGVSVGRTDVIKETLFGVNLTVLAKG